MHSEVETLHLPIDEVPVGEGWELVTGNTFMNRWERKTPASAPEIVARLGTHPSRPERWAIVSPAGVVMNWLDRKTASRAAVMADLAPVLARAGLVLRNDNTIVRAADLGGTTDPIASAD